MAGKHEDADDKRRQVGAACPPVGPADGGAGGGHVVGRGAGGTRGLIAGIAQVEKGGVAEIGVGLKRFDGLVARGVPNEGEPDAFCEKRRGCLADEGQIGRGRDEVPVAAAVLHGEFAEDFGEAGDGDVLTAAFPAPGRVLTVEAFHRAAREEDAAAAVFADERRLFAEVRSPAEDARKRPRAAEAGLAVFAVHSAGARAESAWFHVRGLYHNVQHPIPTSRRRRLVI